MKLSDITHHTVDDSETNPSWPYRIDGYLTSKETYAFATALRRASPSMRFMGSNDKELLTVYYVGTDYSVGQIMTGYNWAKSRSDKLQYVVDSRKIENKKYDLWGNGKTRLYSSDMKKAVKNALRYLQPFTLDEIVSDQGYFVSRNLSVHRGAVVQELAKITDPMREEDVLTREVLALAARGVAFETKEFQAAAVQLEELSRNKKLVYSTTVNFLLVVLRQVGQDILATCGKTYERDLSTLTESFEQPLAELPEWVHVKIAQLQMVDLEVFIPGIGKRTTENTFWLVLEKDDGIQS